MSKRDKIDSKGDGKVVEKESIYDMLDFYKQLGVIEYTEKAKKLLPKDVK